MTSYVTTRTLSFSEFQSLVAMQRIGSFHAERVDPIVSTLDGATVGWSVEGEPPGGGRDLLGVTEDGKAVWAWPETSAQFVRWVRKKKCAFRDLKWEDKKKHLEQLDGVIDMWFDDQFGTMSPAGSEIDLASMSKTNAALALWRVCREAAREEDMLPGIEVFCHTPEDCQDHIEQSSWRVCWESGPPQWGVELSCANSVQLGSFLVRFGGKPQIDRDSWYVEPYYSFDVCFVE